MGQDLSTTSYALLGLLVFDGPDSAGLTGYELKQRADKTLRFYWVSPAMSQIYTELDRLHRRSLVVPRTEQSGQRTTVRYRISAAGQQELEHWLAGSEVEFPVLKHPVALRLMMGALAGPDQTRRLLQDYLTRLAEQREALLAVRQSLGEAQNRIYPAMVADWGLGYYDAEAGIVGELLARLDGPTAPARAGHGTTGPMSDLDSEDQDSEPTMTAPLEGRPDGIADPSVAETQSDIRSQDADDQSGSEDPES